MKKKLIEQGVANLKEFGYPSVDAENILTDPIYSSFFKSMLEENKGISASIDKDIDEILATIAQP